MTETAISTIVVALCAAAPPTILALASLRQGRANNVVARATSAQVLVNDAKTDNLIEKTTEIHTLTNGNLHVVTKELATANEKIQGLERLMARIVGDEQVRLNLAEKAAQNAPPIAEKLDSIQTTTEAIDSKVDVIKGQVVKPGTP